MTTSLPHPEKEPRVLVLGAGGLGVPVVMTLLRATSAELTVWDPDFVALSNLHRQVLYAEDEVGLTKATAMSQSVARNFGEEADRVRTEERAISANDFPDIFGSFDLIVEGTDSPNVKFMINDEAQRRSRPTLIGGLARWSGALFLVGTGEGGCFRCLFEAVPEEDFLSCEQSGILGPLAGVVGGLLGAQAVELLEGRAPERNHWVRVTPMIGPTRGMSLSHRVDCPSHPV